MSIIKQPTSMKTTYFILTAVLICFIGTSKAQNCERNGTFTGGTVQGGVKLKTNKKGTMFVQFDGEFSSSDGPDVNIYLSNSGKADESSILIHSLDALTAAQRYKVLEDFDINQYKYVVIHCTKYDHHFGTATLGTSEGEGCPLKE